MTMKALRCTQCGAELEFDNSKDFGFCYCCGTKIMLKEKKEVIHSGEVQMVMNNRQQGLNRLELANTAFSAGNYQEAYTYYTKTLEDLPENLTAIFRKGICAIYLSNISALKNAELEAQFDRGVALIDTTFENMDPESEEYSQKLDEFEETLTALENDIFEMTERMAAKQTYYIRTGDLETAQHQTLCWLKMAELYGIAYTGLITPDAQETILTKGISFCTEVMGMRTKYYTHTTVNKKGKSKDHYADYNMSSAEADMMAKWRDFFRAEYSELPSVAEKNEKIAGNIAEADIQAANLEMEMNTAKGIMENAKSAFYNDHPEFKAKFNRSQTLSWLCLVPSVFLIAITLFSWRYTVAVKVLAMLTVIPALKIKRKMAAKAAVKLEEEIFPEELKEIENKYYDAVDAWEENEKLRAELKEEEAQAKKLAIAA